MKMSIYKTGELNSSSYVKFLLRSNAILNVQNVNKYCFIWSILAYLQPFNNSHPTRLKNFIQFFIELNIEGFNFSNGFRCSDVPKFEETNSLFINIFEINFYQDQD